MSSTAPSPPMATAVQGLSQGGLAYMSTGIVMALLSQAAVVLRIICRLKRFKGLATDDWTIIAAQFLAYCQVAAVSAEALIGGIGWPILSLPPTQLSNFFKIFFASEITYSLICPLVKISVLLLYRRIFTTPRFKLVTLFFGILCAAWGVAVVGVSIFQCRPIEGFWNPMVREYCVDSQTFFWGNGISNLLLDVMILCLPIPMVWQLQLSRPKKFAIMGMFLLGSFVCLASIMRIAMLGRIADIDFTLTLPPAATWSIVEPCVGIISACLPTLRPLFQKDDHYSSNSRRACPEMGNVRGDGSSQGQKEKKRAKALAEGWQTESEVYSEMGSRSDNSSMRKPSEVDLLPKSRLASTATATEGDTAAPLDPQLLMRLDDIRTSTTR